MGDEEETGCVIYTQNAPALHELHSPTPRAMKTRHVAEVQIFLKNDGLSTQRMTNAGLPETLNDGFCTELLHMELVDDSFSNRRQHISLDF